MVLLAMNGRRTVNNSTVIAILVLFLLLQISWKPNYQDPDSFANLMELLTVISMTLGIWLIYSLAIAWEKTHLAWLVQLFQELWNTGVLLSSDLLLFLYIILHK